MDKKKSSYYLPDPSPWPIIGSVGLGLFFVGFANWLHEGSIGPYLAICGLFVVLYTVTGWFGTLIQESQAGHLHHPQITQSFKWGVIWFIFTEVAFFATFFGALLYVRLVTIPWLGGEHASGSQLTHLLLWPHFSAHWPLFHNPSPSRFVGPHGVMATWGIPAFNTAILLLSGVTITIAHWGILKEKKHTACLFQCCTILLGWFFLFMQVQEYAEAYHEKGLTLASGIYGSLFFLLTGFHGLHVFLGTVMLCVIAWRMYAAHFDAAHHFAFEAVSWYWHFVDVVWLTLFVFVYWL